jgi:hypothetical protein
MLDIKYSNGQEILNSSLWNLSYENCQPIFTLWKQRVKLATYILLRISIKSIVGCGSSSVVKTLPSMCKILSSVPIHICTYDSKVGEIVSACSPIYLVRMAGA